MQTLRDEILQAQQARSDLLKWKLAVAGALGAIGLGFAGADHSVTNADLILCAIPPLCLYVDLLCRHLSLRILVIGTFVRRHGTEYGTQELAAYEEHAQEARNMHWEPSLRLAWESSLRPGSTVSAFALEDWAVSWSTIALSGAILAYGIGSKEFRLAFIASGVLGLAVTGLASLVYKNRVKATNKLP